MSGMRNAPTLRVEGNEPTPAAIELLRPYANEHSRAEVTFWSNIHRPFADDVASAFRLAGWDVNFNGVAQELRNLHYRSGIDVAGSNSHLVEVAVKAITLLGGWDVKPNVNETQFPRDHPKWASSQNSVRVTIGHRRPARP